MGNPWDWPTAADKQADVDAGITHTRWYLWIPRFERYLALKGSLTGVYNEERELARKKPHKSAPGPWFKNAERWGWAKRYAAYVIATSSDIRDARDDAAQAEKEQWLADDRTARQDARKLRRALLRSAQFLTARVAQQMARAEQTPPDVDDVGKLVVTIARLNTDLRAEFSDLPAMEIDAQYDIVLSMRSDGGHKSEDEDGLPDYGEPIPEAGDAGVFDYTGVKADERDRGNGSTDSD